MRIVFFTIPTNQPGEVYAVYQDDNSQIKATVISELELFAGANEAPAEPAEPEPGLTPEPEQ